MSTSERQPRALRIPLAGPLSLFLLGGGLGLLASYDASLSAPGLLWLSAGTALYIAVVSIARSDAHLRWAAVSAVVAATLAALVLAAQYRYLGFEEKFGVIARLGRFTSAPFPPIDGQFVQQNAVATFLEGALPLVIGLAAASRGLWRLTWLACVLVIAWGVVLTGSRGAWAALAMGALLGGLATLRSASLRRWNRTWLARAMVLAGITLVGIALIGASHRQHILDSAAFRAADRWTLYRNSLFLALDFPLSGIGPGATFGMIYSHFQLLIPVFYLGYAHNLFLAIWLGQGLLGLLGFGGLLLASGRLVWRGLLHGDDRPSSRIGRAAAVGCAVVLLHGLTDAPQYGDAWYAMLMIFVLLGVMIAAACLVDDRPLTWVRLDRAGWAVATLLLAGILAFGGRSLLALASANVAAILEARAILGPNLDDVERATQWSAALAWANRGLQIDAESRAVLKERGMLALAIPDNDFDMAIRMLEPALRYSPADQSVRKALGYAYIWQGRVDEGVALLKGIERTGEIEGELQVWPYAWRDRGRPDLAAQAERAALLMAAQGQR
jgi:putative inorganic carbon (hco3(-)) transporter